MTTTDFITALFYEIDEKMRTMPKHPDARLWPWLGREQVVVRLALQRPEGMRLQLRLVILLKVGVGIAPGEAPRSPVLVL